MPVRGTPLFSRSARSRFHLRSAFKRTLPFHPLLQSNAWSGKKRVPRQKTPRESNLGCVIPEVRGRGGGSCEVAVERTEAYSGSHLPFTHKAPSNLPDMYVLDQWTFCLMRDRSASALILRSARRMTVVTPGRISRQ